MSENFTLDSFALLSWLQNEKGAEKVDNLISRANRGQTSLFLCAVNLGEVYYIACRERGETLAQHALTVIDNLPIKLFNADKPLSLKAAEFKAAFPIAYADAFAAALGITTKSAVVTGDPEFKALKDLIEIEWLDK